MQLSKFFPLVGVCALLLSACAPNYSPNVYSSNAVQLANKVEAGTVIGFREVKISANGNIGAVTGGAVGGVLGAEYANSALIAVGGTTVGGMLGSALEHAARDTTGWEYIIRKDNGDMLSVTQREATPLTLAQRVLVIMGPQARVVPDYSIPQEPKIAAAPVDEKNEKKESKAEPVKVEVVLSLPPGVMVQPKTDEVKVAVEEPAPAPRPAPFEERLLDAVTMTNSLADILAQSEAHSVEVPTAEAEIEPVAEAAEATAEPEAPPSQR
jgi:outer membrane lipoprotein SlyB